MNQDDAMMLTRLLVLGAIVHAGATGTAPATWDAAMICPRQQLRPMRLTGGGSYMEAADPAVYGKVEPEAMEAIAKARLAPTRRLFEFADADHDAVLGVNEVESAAKVLQQLRDEQTSRQLVPTKLVYRPRMAGEASDWNVSVVGDWSDWLEMHDTRWNAVECVFECQIELPAGLHEFKFIVNNVWDTSTDYRLVDDHCRTSGNNCLHVDAADAQGKEVARNAAAEAKKEKEELYREIAAEAAAAKKAQEELRAARETLARRRAAEEAAAKQAQEEQDRKVAAEAARAKKAQEEQKTRRIKEKEEQEVRRKKAWSVDASLEAAAEEEAAKKAQEDSKIAAKSPNWHRFVPLVAAAGLGAFKALTSGPIQAGTLFHVRGFVAPCSAAWERAWQQRQEKVEDEGVTRLPALLAPVTALWVLMMWMT